MINFFNPVLGKIRWVPVIVTAIIIAFGVSAYFAIDAIADTPPKAPPITVDAMRARTGQVAARACRRHAKRWNAAHPEAAYRCGTYGADYCKVSKLDNRRGHCMGWFQIDSYTTVSMFCTATVKWVIVMEPGLFGTWWPVIRKTNSPRWDCDPVGGPE